MDPTKLHELMDACRSGHDDLQLPEMAELVEAMRQDAALEQRFRNSQALDRALQDALADVSLPDGLAGRLLAATTNLAAVEAAEQQAATSGPSVHIPRTRPVAVWLWKTAAAVAAVAALLLVGSWLWSLGDHTLLTAEQLTAQAEQWVTELDEEQWQRDARPGGAYALDDSVRMPKDCLWQRVRCLEDRQAVVYFDERADAAALVFVIRSTQVSPLPPVPPVEPQQLTGKRLIGAWSSKGRVFVLVVEGGIAAYQDRIQSRTVAGISLPDYLTGRV